MKARLENARRVGDIHGELERALGSTVRAELHNVEHHQAHAASAFFVSPFEEAAILTVDGFGDFASTLLARRPRKPLRGARPRALPALARDPLHGDHAVARLPEVRRRGQGDGPRARTATRSATCARMRELVRLERALRARPGLLHAPARGRRPDLGGGHAEDRAALLGHGSSRRSAEPKQRFEDVAAALQAVLEEAYLHLVRELDGRTRLQNLCLAGGVALNAVANGAHPARDRLRRPLRSAGGRRLGHGDRRRLLGLEPAPRPAARIRDGARVHRARSTPRRSAPPLCGPPGSRRSGLTTTGSSAETARRIADGEVVGWFQGRMEFGPRALGNRSIVVDPAPRRHEGRPQRAHQAPRAVPPVRAVDPRRGDGRLVRAGLPSPFMVLVYKTRPEKRSKHPGGEPRRRHRAAADSRGSA